MLTLCLGPKTPFPTKMLQTAQKNLKDDSEDESFVLLFICPFSASNTGIANLDQTHSGSCSSVSYLTADRCLRQFMK